MARLSKQTKEIIQIIIFLVVVGLLVTAYIIYPLNRIKAQMARVDMGEYNEDSLPSNSADYYINEGLPADTFSFEPDGLIKLACLYINNDSAKGTFVVLHKEKDNRDSVFELSKKIYDLGYSVIAYDQRASGYTNGKYRSDGYQEASDLEELISTLEIREMIVHPLYVLGLGLGADAAYLASQDEQRINGIISVNPFLTTRRMQDVLKERYESYWFPFYRTIMWWWYKMQSSLAPPYREIEDIEPVSCPTWLIVDEDNLNSPEVQKLIEISDKNKLIVIPDSGEPGVIDNAILSLTGQ